MKTIRLFATVFVFVVGLTPLIQPTRQTKAGDKIEITFVNIFVSDSNDDRSQRVQELVNEFMAQRPEIVVNIQATTPSYRDILQATLLAAGQGNPPHVVQLEEGATQIAIDSGYFVKITDIATEEQIAALDDFLPQILNFYIVEGEVWSLPWNSSNPILYYNKNIFQQAGLDPEVAPVTFDDVLAMCDTIMNAGLDLTGCINWPLTGWFTEEWVTMQNALLVNNDNGRAGRATETFLNSPEMLRVLEWWKEMADRGYYVYTGVTQDYTGEAAAFITQRFAMHLNSTAGLANFIRFSTVLGYELGVAPLIIPDENARAGVATGGGAIWLTAEHPQAELEAARDFMFFLTNSENIAIWHQVTGYIPNRTSSLQLLEQEGWFEQNPFYRIAVDQMLNTTPTPATAGAVLGTATEMRQFVEEAVQSVIDQGEDPAAALEAAKQRADEALQAYNEVMGS